MSLASLESIAVPDKRPPKVVLQDVTFTVKPGQLVALVGPSAAGKTTITHLVPRLYDVQDGSIRIQGVDVRDATLESLRERIGLVTQGRTPVPRQYSREPQLCEAGSDRGANQGCPARGADTGVGRITARRLDTLVGERGYRFSGGEKHGLAIARLLLKDPDIVILDEATAHLDSNSESAIQQALERALTGRTSVVIAHRLSTILKADQICSFRTVPSWSGEPTQNFWLYEATTPSYTDANSLRPRIRCINPGPGSAALPSGLLAVLPVAAATMHEALGPTLFSRSHSARLELGTPSVGAATSTAGVGCGSTHNLGERRLQKVATYAASAPTRPLWKRRPYCWALARTNTRAQQHADRNDDPDCLHMKRFIDESQCN